MMDFHTHLLPEMDDGSRSVEESLAMLKQMAAQNINWAAATPPFLRFSGIAGAVSGEAVCIRCPVAERNVPMSGSGRCWRRWEPSSNPTPRFF